MRDPETIERELVEIGAIQEDATKLERIVAWCATYPEEIPVALRFFREQYGGGSKAKPADAG